MQRISSTPSGLPIFIWGLSLRSQSFCIWKKPLLELKTIFTIMGNSLFRIWCKLLKEPCTSAQKGMVPCPKLKTLLTLQDEQHIKQGKYQFYISYISLVLMKNWHRQQKTGLTILRDGQDKCEDWTVAWHPAGFSEFNFNITLTEHLF